MNLEINFDDQYYANINRLSQDFCINITNQFGCDISEIHLLLPRLIKNIKPKKYGEIGSHAGRSAFFAASSSEEYQTEIYCFDYPNAGWGGQFGTQFFLEKSLNLTAKNRHKIYYGDSHSELIKKEIVNNGPYDIFLIDGDHSFQGMVEDFESVYHTINNNGLILIDDLYHHPELNMAFDTLIQIYKIKIYQKYFNLSDITNSYPLLYRGIGIIQKI